MGSTYDIDKLLPSPSVPGHDLACEVFTRESVEKKLAVAKLRLVWSTIPNFDLLLQGLSWKYLLGWKMFQSS